MPRDERYLFLTEFSFARQRFCKCPLRGTTASEGWKCPPCLRIEAGAAAIEECKVVALHMILEETTTRCVLRTQKWCRRGNTGGLITIAWAGFSSTRRMSRLLRLRTCSCETMDACTVLGQSTRSVCCLNLMRIMIRLRDECSSEKLK